MPIVAIPATSSNDLKVNETFGWQDKNHRKAQYDTRGRCTQLSLVFSGILKYTSMDTPSTKVQNVYTLPIILRYHFCTVHTQEPFWDSIWYFSMFYEIVKRFYLMVNETSQFNSRVHFVCRNESLHCPTQILAESCSCSINCVHIYLADTLLWAIGCFIDPCYCTSSKLPHILPTILVWCLDGHSGRCCMLMS